MHELNNSPFPWVFDNMELCDTSFLGRLSCYPCYSKSEGNTLAATEFVSPLEASGSVIQQNNPAGRERKRSSLAPTVEFNPTRSERRT